MKTQSLAALAMGSALALILLFACDLPTVDRPPTHTPSPVPSATPTEIAGPRCRESSEPTQEDIDDALDFGRPVLENDEWQRTYQVGTDRVRVTWTHDRGGLIFLEALIFVCGYTSEDLDQFFSRETIEEIIYAEYQDVEITASCIHDDQGLRLYEISAMWDGQPYAIRHWVLTTHPERVDQVLIAFPEPADLDLATYAPSLFPKLVSCSD